MLQTDQISGGYKKMLSKNLTYIFSRWLTFKTE